MPVNEVSKKKFAVALAKPTITKAEALGRILCSCREIWSYFLEP